MRSYSITLCIFLVLTGLSHALTAQSVKTPLPAYKPSDPALYAAISRMDSLFFDAYNNCKLAVMDSILSEDLEFYHDMGGLSTSKTDIMTALKNNICNKVRRDLIEGTIEVYPIANFGAIEMGWHQFFNKMEPNAKPHPSKFVQTWKWENGKWYLVRVISLH